MASKSFLMLMNTKELLDKIYNEVSDVIIRRQHPVTGLLPASTAVNTHGDYTDAWVRDNVYSIMCVWALALAFRRHGDKFRCDELSQCTIKLMRGLLQSMMRQADKVETFKTTFHPHDALHAKYDTRTGLPVVADHAWGHLQIDATSLYLLMMGQMSASGLRIVKTYSEVDFVQNLIYYIGSAYRTPDFGIWERGNKINNGKTEINASSVGMAKAALQALDGFNLFSRSGPPRATLHTVPDAVSHARNVLASLLPRESLSKEVDSALLSVIGYPAFAVGDQELVTRTRDEILDKLGGNYGCKRFLWDGHQTVVEESSRIHYERSELANFDHIESEWPLFFTYLYIAALFDGNESTAAFYRKKIESVMVEKDGFGLIPELYYVPKEHIEEERKDPGSQKRVPNENLPLVWAQSLYLTGVLLDEGLISKDDLDPLKMRARATRYVKSQIALVVLAENDEVKQLLAENGVIAESIDDIKPLGVMSAPHLRQAYYQVGANEALGLSGRPNRRLQSLATSQTYSLNDRNFLCLSWLQSETGDYRLRDAKLFADLVEREIAQIRKHWINNEVAVFTLMLGHDLCQSPSAKVLFDRLRNLQLRTDHESVGYASANLAFRASRVNHLHVPNFCITPLEPAAIKENEIITELFAGTKHEAVTAFLESYGESDFENYKALTELIAAVSADDVLLEKEKPLYIKDLLTNLYCYAENNNHWLTARYCFILLELNHEDLGDALVVFSSRHLDVVVGGDKERERVFDVPIPNEELAQIIKDVVDSPIENALVQEMFAVIGSLARSTPRLFEGMRTVHIHNLLTLCAISDNRQLDLTEIEELGGKSPYELTDKVRNILSEQRKIYDQGVNFNFCQRDINSEQLFTGKGKGFNAIDTDWLEWRLARGLMPRFESSFLKDIWQSLAHTERLVFGDISNQQDCTIDSALTQSSMTPGEESFARYIDQLVQQLHPAFYKSAIVETLYAYTQFCKEHPDVKFEKNVVLGEVLEAAADNYVADNKIDVGHHREIDLFLEKSPYVLQEYVAGILKAEST